MLVAGALRGQQVDVAVGFEDGVVSGAAEAGFTPQSRVRVRVMTDCLVITREETTR